MLSKILAAFVLVLTISLGTVGYLYKQEITANAALVEKLDAKATELLTCQNQKKNTEEDKEDTVDSLELVADKAEKTDKDFKQLETELLKIKNACKVEKKPTTGVANNAVPQDSGDPAVAADIKRVLGVLSTSYCLSNGSCGNP